MKSKAARASAKRIAVFNHKGGVGKTTLTVNIAAAVATKGKRVLLIDSDPQCNLTAYLIEESVVDDLLDKSDTPDGETLWSAVKPVVEGTGDVKTIKAIDLGRKLSLLPGDVRLAEFEQELGSLWGECFQRKVRGFRGTCALSLLINSLCVSEQIDYVFYDSGPNIGALNRVILLDCDYFIIPVACDLFSLRAIKTLGHTLAGWIQNWRSMTALAPQDLYLFPGTPKLLGYVPQRYRVYRGLPAGQYAPFLPRIEKAIQSDVVTVLRRVDSTLIPYTISQLRLGDVKDFSSLANASQGAGVAMFDAESGTEEQRMSARQTFNAIAEKVILRAR